MTALGLAVTHNNTRAIEILHKLGANLNAQVLTAVDQNTTNALGLAVELGNIALIESLIASGVDVDAPAFEDEYGPITALELAIDSHQIQAIKTLLDLGAKIGNLNSNNKKIQDLIDKAKNTDEFYSDSNQHSGENIDWERLRSLCNTQGTPPHLIDHPQMRRSTPEEAASSSSGPSTSPKKTSGEKINHDRDRDQAEK